MDKAFVYSKPLVFDSTVMTGTAVCTSRALDVRHLNNIGFVLNWTGTPTGTFAVQVSTDFVPGGGLGSGEAGLASPKVAGTWVDVILGNQGTFSQPSGAAGPKYVWFQHFPFPWVRVVYTNTSSTGAALAGTLSGKSI
jgi:hypothetical protein